MKTAFLACVAFSLSGCVIETTPGPQYNSPPQPMPAPPSVVQPPPAPPPVADMPPPPPPVPVVVVPPPLPETEIVLVYEDLLGRPPSRQEVWEWREQSRLQPTTPDDVRREIRRSGEFQWLAPETVIRRAYRDYLRREPDAVAMRYFRRRMIDDGWSAGRVRQTIAHGAPGLPDERRRQGDDDDGERGRRHGEEPHRMGPRGEFETRSPDVIIARAYDDLLERAPDREGLERYRRMLERGESESQIRSRIRQSVEYRVTLPDSKTTRAYRDVLGRDPDASGLESYRRKIVDQGWTEEDVAADLRKSAEYRNRKR